MGELIHVDFTTKEQLSGSLNESLELTSEDEWEYQVDDRVVASGHLTSYDSSTTVVDIATPDSPYVAKSLRALARITAQPLEVFPSNWATVTVLGVLGFKQLSFEKGGGFVKDTGSWPTNQEIKEFTQGLLSINKETHD